ncbi:MAG: AhpC/TSA family protein [Bacteroidales bacterium]|nr:AhpC/TSA family protein [Bacteroidales bacterium]
MKHSSFLLLLVLVVFFASCGDKQNYTVICQSDYIPEGSQIVLYDMFGEAVVDSAVFSKGEAVFKGFVEQPFVGFVFVGNTPLSMLMVEPGTIHYGIDSDTLYGTALNAVMTSYIRELHSLQMEIMSKGTNRPSEKELESIRNRYAELNWRYYHQNEDNEIGAFMLLAMVNNAPKEILSYDQFDSVLAGASPKVREFKAIREAQERIALTRRTALGMPVVDFEGIDFATGRPSSLVKMIDGKLALVDFWASWCAPCRAIIKGRLIDLYEKYKDKGLVIVGVDVMDKPSDHQKASEQLGIPYPQLIDNSEDNKAATLYGITAIPFIMLVSPDGTIIGKGLSDKELEPAILQALK